MRAEVDQNGRSGPHEEGAQTHERIANVEDGEYGQDRLEDAASEEPQPLLVEGEVGGAQLSEWQPAELDAALAEVEREFGRGVA